SHRTASRCKVINIEPAALLSRHRTKSSHVVADDRSLINQQLRLGLHSPAESCGFVPGDGTRVNGGLRIPREVPVGEESHDAATLKGAAVLKRDIGQRKVGVAAGAGVGFHAAAVTVIAVGAVVHAILYGEVRDAARGI